MGKALLLSSLGDFKFTGHEFESTLVPFIHGIRAVNKFSIKSTCSLSVTSYKMDTSILDSTSQLLLT